MLDDDAVVKEEEEEEESHIERAFEWPRREAWRRCLLASAASASARCGDRAPPPGDRLAGNPQADDDVARHATLLASTHTHAHTAARPPPAPRERAARPRCCGLASHVQKNILSPPGLRLHVPRAPSARPCLSRPRDYCLYRHVTTADRRGRPEAARSGPQAHHRRLFRRRRRVQAQQGAAAASMGWGPNGHVSSAPNVLRGPTMTAAD